VLESGASADQAGKLMTVIQFETSRAPNAGLNHCSLGHFYHFEFSTLQHTRYKHISATPQWNRHSVVTGERQVRARKLSGQILTVVTLYQYSRRRAKPRQSHCGCT